MLRNYLQILLRIAARNKLITAFNILGLSVGVASFIIITLYVKKETGYDHFNKEPEKLYRLVTDFSSQTESFSNAQSTPALVAGISNQFPKITAATRLFRYRSDVIVVDKETNTNYTEPNFLWADADIFNVFNIELTRGDPATTITRPRTVIISESIARKYFGHKDPIGKLLNNVTFTAEFEVTAIFKDLPDNSHFKADFICSLETLKDSWGKGIMNNWYNSFLYSYIRVSDPAAAAGIERDLNTVMHEHIQLPAGSGMKITLQPLTDIHLTSHLLNELDTNGNKMYVYILSAVGFLILIVSCINFVNLGIARSERRSKEIGVRKALGSLNRNISAQFITENVFYGSVAFFVSIALIALLLPYINRLFGSQLTLFASNGISAIVIGFVSVLLIVLITSAYPAIFIAGIRIVEVLRGKPVKLGGGINLWRGLVVFQVTVAVFLLASSLILDRQLTYLQSKKLGYETSHTINIPLLTDHSQAHYRQLKDNLLQNSNIQYASATSHLIGGQLYQSVYGIHKSNQEKALFTWQRFHADYDFVNTNGLELAAGRDFSLDFPSDTTAFIINEAACRALGLAEPQLAIGLDIDRDNGGRGKIIGVIRDFHFKSLHQFIEPLVVHYEPGRFRFLTVNFKQGAESRSAIRFIGNEWSKFEPAAPFVYTFPEQFTNKMYSFEQNLRSIITAFTIIALLLSVGGLIGLNYYIVHLKAKEISIRKVLGASITGIIALFSGSFMKLILVALLIAFPASGWAMTFWLQEFAYRTNISAWIFIMAGLSVITIALLTISFHTIKAAIANPVKSLRN